MKNSLHNSLKNYMPGDHSSQITPEYYLERLFKQDNNIEFVMDLGCGIGRSLNYFRYKKPDIKWLGLDIDKSPEVELRTRAEGEFCTFDGIHLPFRDNQFDIIYCNQVLEHVHYPYYLLKEACRVLKPGGHFVGATSQLEPYHSYSLWNYSPYGFCFLINEIGLCLVEIRPSIDALTLIIRRGLGQPRYFSHWWVKESPLNLAISLVGKAVGKRHSWINTVKLLFCGQFCFLVRKQP
jgi:ubiquinone/menaquinone biosynthesis C-methylase UbiE